MIPHKPDTNSNGSRLRIQNRGLPDVALARRTSSSVLSARRQARMPAVPERQGLDRSPPASSPLRLPVEDLNDTDSSALDEDHVDVEAPSSAEEGAHFGQSLQIDMKTLVGDAVGNVSERPTSSWRATANRACRLASVPLRGTLFSQRRTMTTQSRSEY